MKIESGRIQNRRASTTASCRIEYVLENPMPPCSGMSVRVSVRPSQLDEASFPRLASSSNHHSKAFEAGHQSAISSKHSRKEMLLCSGNFCLAHRVEEILLLGVVIA